jgi:hypothetical protein
MPVRQTHSIDRVQPAEGHRFLAAVNPFTDLFSPGLPGAFSTDPSSVVDSKERWSLWKVTRLVGDLQRGRAIHMRRKRPGEFGTSEVAI